MAQEHKPDNKMIQIKIYLWTDKLAPKRDGVLKKHAWEAGYVCLPSNTLHGIKASPKERFHGFPELRSTVDKVLKKSGVTVEAISKNKPTVRELPSGTR